MIRFSLARTIRPRQVGCKPGNRASSQQSSPHPADAEIRQRSRVARLNARLPPSLRRYTTPLLAAPLSHTTAFIVLHEITAIVPLISLTAVFHYVLGGVPDRATQWLAGNELLVKAEKRFASYFRRKGWISEAEADEVKQVAETDNGEDPKGALTASSGGAGMRLVVEVAAAYAITKALLPLRLGLSLWATPWFARTTIVPISNGIRRVFGTATKTSAKKG